MRTGTLAIAACALLAFGAEAKKQPTESYFGKRGEFCPAPDFNLTGTPVHAIRSSDPDPEDKGIVEAFYAAIRKGDKRTLGRLAGEWPATAQGLSCIDTLSQLLSQCTPMPQYLLGDLEIRTDWNCQDRIKYHSFITIEGGKITNVNGDFRPPVIVRIR